MSEYQRYEFMTIDRPLTRAQLDAVNALSSHIEASSTHALIEYHWGDFKHNPIKVLHEFFDGFLYWANWGSPELAFRFPHGILPVDLIMATISRFRVSSGLPQWRCPLSAGSYEGHSSERRRDRVTIHYFLQKCNICEKSAERLKSHLIPLLEPPIDRVALAAAQDSSGSGILHWAEAKSGSVSASAGFSRLHTYSVPASP